MCAIPSETALLSLEELKARGRRNYEEARGRIILSEYVIGYRKDDPHGNLGRFELYPDPPAAFRVSDTSEDDLFARCLDWMDPEWGLELIGKHPMLEAYDGFNLQAPSRHPDGRVGRGAWWVFDPEDATRVTDEDVRVWLKLGC